MDLEREAGAKPWPTLDVILMNADSVLQVGWGGHQHMDWREGRWGTGSPTRTPLLGFR